jgi:DHA1 family multidrug resistance protein-like MFS transporter
MSISMGISFIPYYAQEMGLTDPVDLKTYVVIVTAIPSLAMGIMSPIWGWLSDRLGKKLMILRAVFFSFISMLGLGLATSIWQLLFFRIIQGVLSGTITASLSFIATNTPAKRLSYALGFIASSTFIGFSAGPAIGGLVADTFGFQKTFLVGAALVFIVFFVAIFLVREDKEQKPAKSKEDIFIKEHGKSQLSLTTIISATLLMMIILFLIRIAASLFFPYLPLFVQEQRGVIEGSSKVTGIINGLAMLMSATAGIVLGKLGEKHNKHSIIMISIIAGVVISSVLLFSKSLIFFAIIYALTMFTMGGIEPLLLSISSIKIPTQQRGTYFGIEGMVGALGWAISPVLAGYVSIKFSIHSILFMIPILLGIILIIVIISKTRNKNEINL